LNFIAKPIRCLICGRLSNLNDKSICLFCENKSKLRIRNFNFPDQFRIHDISPKPFTSTPILNLHYFLYPRYLQSSQWHLDRLRCGIEQFNGKRVCCVAVDENTCQSELRDQLDELFTDVYYVPNNPSRRELVGFVPTLTKLFSLDVNEAVCFAHAKGQQAGTSVCPLIRKWVEACYETVVFNWGQVRPAMETGYPLAGSFKVLGQFRSSRYKWHYSGSYWWGRSASIFTNQHWQSTCNHWWGSESYVGRHWSHDEGYCLFADNVVASSTYSQEMWATRYDAELDQWRSSKHSVNQFESV